MKLPVSVDISGRGFAQSSMDLQYLGLAPHYSLDLLATGYFS